MAPVNRHNFSPSHLYFDILPMKFCCYLIHCMSLRFDIEGHVTGFGNPDWERTHAAASRTSPLISTLVEGGATCVGKTVIDELAFRYAQHLAFFFERLLNIVKIVWTFVLLLAGCIYASCHAILILYPYWFMLQYQWRK